VPWAVEETLRWETSVLMIARQTNREVDIRATRRSRTGDLLIIG
jgi:cytochrome P450